MKNIILDTDIGSDCDDAVAICMLIKAAQKKLAKISAVTTSTTREGATACIKAIANFYDADFPIGRMFSPVLECDAKDAYAKYVKERYQLDDTNIDGVKLIRKLLSESNEKFTFITIGPLSNLNNVFDSKADEFSEKSGIDLFHEKVNELFCMGGSFCSENEFPLYQNSIPMRCEWNIIQDITAAQNVISKTKIPLFVIPFEAGNRVFCGNSLKKAPQNPAWQCMENFAKNNNISDILSFSRESWDPIAVYSALYDIEQLFELSEEGTISVEQDGRTTFQKTLGGTHRYLSKNKQTFEEISKIMESKI